MRRLAFAIGILAVLTVARSAGATPSARLVYSRSANATSCPDETALHKAVAARFGYDPFFAWARQTVVVQISRDRGRYAARLQLVDEQGLARGTREIRSDEPSCAELFDAAALAISIALDASTSIVPAPPTSQDVVMQASPPSPGPALVVPETSPPYGDSAAHPAAPVAAAAATGPWRIGVDALASAWVAPNVAPGIAAFAAFRARAVSLGLEFQTDVSIPATTMLRGSLPSTAHVTSALFAAALVPCAHYGATVFCAIGEVGWLQAWGWGTTSGASDGALFVGVGARAGVEWPLSGRLFMRIHADLLGNLNGASFQLANETVWSARPMVAALGAGLETSFP
ncbi:MAG: hypothetical protein M3O46_02765 [Myxococcota bacterium]|nr:hypothetical protein [Myxococcota bacterium]